MRTYKYQTAPHKYQTAPHKYQTAPHKYQTAPHTNIRRHHTQISDGTTQISDGTTHKYQTAPHKYQTAPHKYQTAPHTIRQSHSSAISTAYAPFTTLQNTCQSSKCRINLRPSYKKKMFKHATVCAQIIFGSWQLGLSKRTVSSAAHKCGCISRPKRRRREICLPQPVLRLT